jgi:predicted nucleic acid-binding protein
MLDTSAMARRNKPSVEPTLTPLIEEGLIARCTFTDIEAGLLGRNTAHHRMLCSVRASWPLVEVDQAMLDRASDVQQLLVRRNHHRAVKSLDLLIAAAAEYADLVVLHYDRDYDRIAKVTGQCTEWIVAAGTAD